MEVQDTIGLARCDVSSQGLKCKCEGLGTVEAYGPPLFSCQAPVFATGPPAPTMYKYAVHKLRNDTKFRKNASSFLCSLNSNMKTMIINGGICMLLLHLARNSSIQTVFLLATQNVRSHWNKLSLGPGNAALQNFRAWEWRSHAFPPTLPLCLVVQQNG